MAVSQQGPPRTLQLLKGALVKDVGHLERPAVATSDCKIFLSCTQSDKTKELIARPTHWFLTNILGISTFLDEQDDPNRGRPNDQILAENAYGCAYAIAILSPNYRLRRDCVRELNTFQRRLCEAEAMLFRAIPVLWKIGNTAGYSSFWDSQSWINNAEINDSPVQFLTQELWPRLLTLLREDGVPMTQRCAVFGGRTCLLGWPLLRKTEESTAWMEEKLAQYVREARGYRTSIPAPFENLRKRLQRAAQKQNFLVVIFVCIAGVALLLLGFSPHNGRGLDCALLPEQGFVQYGTFVGKDPLGRRIEITHTNDGVVEHYPDASSSSCATSEPVGAIKSLPNGTKTVQFRYAELASKQGCPCQTKRLGKNVASGSLAWSSSLQLDGKCDNRTAFSFILKRVDKTTFHMNCLSAKGVSRCSNQASELKVKGCS